MGWLVYSGVLFRVVNDQEIIQRKLDFVVPDTPHTVGPIGDSGDNPEEALQNAFESYTSKVALFVSWARWGTLVNYVPTELITLENIGDKLRWYIGKQSENRCIDITFLSESSTGFTYRLEYKRNNTVYYTFDYALTGKAAITSTTFSYRLWNIPWVYEVDGVWKRFDFSLTGSVKNGAYEANLSRCWSDMYSNATWAPNFLGGLQPKNNPYEDGGISDTGGGENTNFTDDSDTPELDELPTINAIGTGFATIFTPSKAELKNLSDIMWNNNVFAALQNLVENIHGMFTSLAMVPFQVTAGSQVEVTWFGFAITEVYLTLAAEQFYEFDMGTINMETNDIVFRSDTALDYSPFSKLGIYLPFIGYEELDIDECRGSAINLVYRIDILSGTCIAVISINGKAIYQFSGNCLTQIPITNENMQSVVSDAVQVGIAAAATHTAKGAVASAGEELAQAGRTGANNAEIKEGVRKLENAGHKLEQSRASLSSATANAAMGMKPSFGKSGSVSASAAMLGVKQPYLFLTTPRQSLPLNYEKFLGFPSNITGKLSEFKGLTVVEDIRLNGLVATSDEVAEIYQLLKEGVII